MKKRFFLIGALVVMSMSAMFVACNQNPPTNGCICTATSRDGEKEIISYTLEDMIVYEEVSTCGELTRVIKEGIAKGWSVSCKGY